VHTGLFWGKVKGRKHLEDLGVNECHIKKGLEYDGKVWTG